MEAATAELRQGAWVQPVNHWQGVPGSIHTDDVARQVGMRGGTIPGTQHLDHFRPLMDELFGDRWLINGTISMYYTFASTHLEDVRAVIKAPPGRCWDEDAIFPAWVEMQDGKIVCKGTVSIGSPSTPNYVRGLRLKSATAGENRIVKVKAGTEAPRVENFVVDASDDGIIRSPTQMFRALILSDFVQAQVNKPAVGFFGATEVALRHGPIRTGAPYTKTGRVICVGVSERTEFAWAESELVDAQGRVIAKMRHMDRWMKALSPLWAA